MAAMFRYPNSIMAGYRHFLDIVLPDIDFDCTVNLLMHRKGTKT
jgi:hypothetical protein